jgi:hypothetical protein
MPSFVARIDSFVLEMLEIEDTFENSIAEYTYPFADGAALDYMGEKARRITFDCIFNKSKYNNHYEFLEHIRSGLLYELVHPRYGSIMGRISNPRVRHDERKNFVTITITFIEQKLGEEVPTVVNIVSQVNSAYTSGITQAMGAFEADVENELGLNSKGLLSKTINFDVGIPLLSQCGSFASTVRNMVADMDRMLGVIDYYMEEITLPADAIIGAIDFGTRLPGRVVGSIAQAVERIAAAKNSVESSPSSFVASFKSAVNDLKKLFGNESEDESVKAVIVNSTSICAALSCGVCVGYLYNSDEQLQAAFEKNIEINSFDNMGRLTATADAVGLYCSNELENSLYMARIMLLEGLNVNRENMIAMKTMAAALENHVTNIKLQRDRIITVDTSGVITPVHVLCRRYGLPYRYLEKIVAINDIQNPTFACGEVKIYERP